MAVKLKSYCLEGLEARIIGVEVDVAQGMPFFGIGGMAGKSVQESKDRIRSALTHSGFKFPLTRKIVNLSPADLSKNGTQFDLAIALGLLLASEQIVFEAGDFMMAGELGLKGEVRAARGILPALLGAKAAGVEKVLIPFDNLKEAGLVEGVKIFAVKNFKEVIEVISGRKGESERVPIVFGDRKIWDFKHISGHRAAKRALIVAAAGGHHVLMSGPPGSGKSLLARSFPSILPPPSNSELLDILKIYSVVGRNIAKLSGERPFRSVHHGASEYALTGGEFFPGEVTLAHNGVLFLDEFPEFSRAAIESLREPLEEKAVCVRRGGNTFDYPCNFQLIAAMNPCPCGFYGDSQKHCECAPYQVLRYKQKLSGPILDRIDIQIEVPRISYDEISKKTGAGSAEILDEVMKAREKQIQRGSINSLMTVEQIRSEKISSEAGDLLKSSSEKCNFSGRAIYKIIKVARTIADLDGSERISAIHIAEALRYRPL